nr:MAG TPA: hypothetical protein [Caudoviricetes sp.]
MSRLLNNILEGFRSLGSLGGDNSLFNDYLKGNDFADMRKDWAAVGADMRKVMNIHRRAAYAR